jgi:hypothetical protein
MDDGGEVEPKPENRETRDIASAIASSSVRVESDRQGQATSAKGRVLEAERQFPATGLIR